MSEKSLIPFKTETQKLLDIIIHSIYTNKEIFLRELISNASDALDKLRFEQNKGTEIISPDLPLEIHIKIDKVNNALIIKDTGIGMTKEELATHLGTIAKSGTEEFIKKISHEKKDIDNIIGKFGVGFYSVFMVAYEVKVRSRSAYPGHKTYEWISDGKNGFIIKESEQELDRGTEIEVHLREDCKDFLYKDKIREIIKKHSNFISFPIFVEDEKINTTQALWKEPKFKIKQEQYNEFYKFLTFDPDDPLCTIHISVDVPVQFSGIVFIPKKSPVFLDSYNHDYGLDLYVSRVLIQKKNKDLVPQYLSFLRGVVDSEDLPLNLSREAIQENALIKKIRSIITKQVLNHLIKLAEKDKDKYHTFWKEHGKIFKLGYMDQENKDKFIELLRFNSSISKNNDDLTSLNEYVSRIKKGQKEIYFISGNTREEIEKSPHLEIFKQKEIEVLYLYEPIDEFILQFMLKYKEYPFKAAEHVNLKDLEKIATPEGKDDKTAISPEDKNNIEELISRIKKILKDKIIDVKISQRLIKSPACLVNPNEAMSSQMQKIIQLIHKDNSIPKLVLELNPNHPLIKNLTQLLKNNPEGKFVDTIIEHLYHLCLIQTGYLSDTNLLLEHGFEIMEKATGS